MHRGHVYTTTGESDKEAQSQSGCTVISFLSSRPSVTASWSAVASRLSSLAASRGRFAMSRASMTDLRLYLISEDITEIENGASGVRLVLNYHGGNLTNLRFPHGPGVKINSHISSDRYRLVIS